MNCRYGYQIPPGQPDHGCGSADTWSDVGSDSEIFCPPGSYCPSTTVKVPCSSGYCFISQNSLHFSNCLQHAFLLNFLCKILNY